MSEHLSHHTPEHHRPQPEAHEQHEGAHRPEHQAHQPERKHPHEDLAAIQARIEQAATGKDQIMHNNSEHGSQQSAPLFVTSELKQMARRRLLRGAQKRLSAPDRAVSKVIHQPAVEQLSELGSRTVARPSGILGGGLVSFVGSLTYYWLTRHYGFRYNFLIFALLFVGGFFLGMTVELLLFVLRHGRRS